MLQRIIRLYKHIINICLINIFSFITTNKWIKTENNSHRLFYVASTNKRVKLQTRYMKQVTIHQK